MEITSDRKQNIDVIGTAGLVKITGLAVFGIIYALGFSWFLRSFLLRGEWFDLLWSSLFAVGYLVMFVLQTFIIRSDIQFGVILFLESAALVGFFLTFTLPILILFALIFSFLFGASHGGRKVLDNMMKIDFSSIAKIVAPRGILAITLLISVFVPLHFQERPDQLPLTSAAFDKLLSGSTVFVQRFYKDFDPSKSLEQIARSSTEKEVNAMPEAKLLPAQEKERIVTRGVQDFYRQVFDFFGAQFDPKDPISKSAYAALETRYKVLSDQTKTWIYVLIGSTIFISIASVMWPIRLLVSLLSLIVYEIMVAVGFVRVVVEQRSKEIVVID